MTKKEYKDLLRSDYLRYSDNNSFIGRLVTYKKKCGYEWSYWFRTYRYLNSHTLLKPLAFLARLHYHKLCVKYGFDIPSQIKHVGRGFKLEHFSYVAIHTDAYIGDNVTIHHGCTIGVKDNGIPIIKDGVDIGAGAIVMGNVTVGENALIGAHSVVTHDVPAGAKVAGNPARILN